MAGNNVRNNPIADNAIILFKETHPIQLHFKYFFGKQYAYAANVTKCIGQIY
jgi:hypothetical protein